LEVKKMTLDNETYNCNIPNEDYVVNFFKKIRWSGGIYCPDCYSKNIEKRDPQGKIHRYKCKNCGNNFSDFTKTIFYKSKVPLNIIFYVLFNRNKTTIQLSKETGYSRYAIGRIKNSIGD
jgi:transposase-like protein